MNVLKAFVNLHEFSDTILVQALRYRISIDMHIIPYPVIYIQIVLRLTQVEGICSLKCSIFVVIDIKVFFVLNIVACGIDVFVYKSFDIGCWANGITKVKHKKIVLVGYLQLVNVVQEKPTGLLITVTVNPQTSPPTKEML